MKQKLGCMHHRELKEFHEHCLCHRTLDNNSSNQPIHWKQPYGSGSSSSNENLLFCCPSPFPWSSIPPANGLLILWSLVNEASFLRTILSHSPGKVCSKLLTAFLGNPFEFLQTDSMPFELSIDSGIMNRDEAIGLQKIEEFIKEVIRVFLDEVQQVLDIIVVKGLKAALQDPWWVYDISSFSP